ncbi:MAG: phospholipase D-like domain-containing protein [Eubacteriales bacterium]|nr:phospholipase D-like domain-containing protein [Eubacteriales bacterium]
MKERITINELKKRPYTKKRSYGVLRIIFSRTFIIMLLIVVEFAFYIFLSNFILNDALRGAFGVIIRIISTIYLFNTSKLQNSYKLTWILLFLSAPIVGLAFFLLLYVSLNNSKVTKNLETSIINTMPFFKKDIDSIYKSNLEKDEQGIFNYMTKYANSFAYKSENIKYYSFGKDYFEDLFVDLQNAKKFIFIESFIISNGIILDIILDILKKKIKEGVVVRLMYDGMSSLISIPLDFDKDIRKLGIECKKFKPLTPFVDSYHNNRDHRKIIVIDDNIAYTGGFNIADEYANIIERFGIWKDTGVRICGEAARSFTLFFLQIWNMTEEKVLDIDYDKFLLKDISLEEDIIDRNDNKKYSYLMPYTDYPKDLENVSNELFKNILNASNEYVYIMTPYLIIDESMINTIISASKRGVEVRIILPHIPDKKYAFALSRSYYRILCENGIKIYEYEKGFVHGKVFLSDNKRAIVGSANLDFRSLYMHYECGIYIYNSKVIKNIYKDFNDTFKECIYMDTEKINKLNKIEKIAGILLRIIAPLM